MRYYEDLVDKFRADIEKVYEQKSATARLIDALLKEKHTLVTRVGIARKKLRHLEGDCLIAAGLVIYLAPFDQKIRDYFKQKWSKMIREEGLKTIHPLLFNAHFLPNETITHWIQMGLPNDSFSIQSAIIRHFCQI